jgi:hypothetical protein
MLGLPPLKNCYFDVPLADVAKKKPLGRINDFLIMVNNNLVPVDFLVLDVECNASCPIILGRPFLRTVGAIIDMKEGTIKYQFPLNKCHGDDFRGTPRAALSVGWRPRNLHGAKSRRPTLSKRPAALAAGWRLH